ncbi:MAG TPA: GTPase ObgE [Anaerolineae bacterium]
MPEERLFFDEAKIFVEAGAGGNGAISFRREKFVPHGGPNGGHGGKGGSVFLRVDPRLNTLILFRTRSHFRAENGQNGRGKDQHGKNGKDNVIPVPPGTVVRDAETGDLIADLVTPEADMLVAQGGRGGRGNSAFASSTNQAPRIAEKGDKGESSWLKLELKLVADIGIVGKPNAGKSTFLASVTAARPKIADYAFTTLIPNLGVAVIDDRSVVIADIPGLIEGAHAGAGLGDKFLRHVSRTRLLIHLVDGSNPQPLADFEEINRELELYSEQLARTPQIVGFNKMDLPDAKANWQLVKKEFAQRGSTAVPVSAATGLGVLDLLRRAVAMLAELPTVTEPVPTGEMKTYRARDDENVFEILRGSGLWSVRGKSVERLAQMTDWQNQDAVLRAHRVLRGMGVTEALKQAGVKEGDSVRLGDVELEWRE